MCRAYIVHDLSSQPMVSAEQLWSEGQAMGYGKIGMNSAVIESDRPGSPRQDRPHPIAEMARM
jgi:hypothetical protein